MKTARLLARLPARRNGAPQPGKKARPKVVIATHTISLQEQILGKDLPFLNSVIPLEFTAVLVKGRRNYLCLRRLDKAMERRLSLFGRDEEVDEIEQIKDWSKSTTDGSLADLDYKPMGQVWDEVACDQGNCMGRNCAHYNTCFYYRARRRIYNAQILIVNHALLFSDLALRQQGVKLLPDYDVVIFDEAHNVESVAGDHLGLSITSAQVQYTLNKLYNDRTNKGLLVHYDLADQQRQVLECHRRETDFFDDIETWLESRPGQNGRVRQANIVENTLSEGLDTLADMVRKQGRKAKSDDEAQDFAAAANRLDAMAAALEEWRGQRLEDAVYWVEKTQRRGYRRIALSASPVNVGPALREQLFKQVDTVVMTSATLATGSGSFDYFKSRIGLTQCESLCLGSPFRLRETSQAGPLGRHARPVPKRRSVRAQGGRNGRALRRADRRTGLRTLHQLRHDEACGHAHNALAGPQEHGPVEPGRRPAANADARRFQSQPPGSALRHRQLLARRGRARRRAGQRHHHAAAVRRARPSPGRGPPGSHQGRRRQSVFRVPVALRRHQAQAGLRPLDPLAPRYGMVVILDPRVRTKRYGKVFLDSLPNCGRVIDSV